MRKKLISLKTLLEEEDIKNKADENDEEKVDESDEDEVTESEEIDENEDQVDESEEVDEDEDEVTESDENEDQVDESDDEDQVDEDFKSWLDHLSKKPPKIKSENGEPDEASEKLDTEKKPGQTDQVKDKLDDEKKPGETKQAKDGGTGDKKDRSNVAESEEVDEDEDQVDESDDEEKVIESEEEEKEKLESEDDEDLLLLEEDEDQVDEDDDEVSESEEVDEDEDQVDESDDEEQIGEAVLDRMLKTLKVEESDVSAFKDILRGAINESVNRTTRKAVKKARRLIIKEANDRIRLVSERKRQSIKKVNEISARAYTRFEESHAKELKKLRQYDEMVRLFTGMAQVMEGFGLSMNPANKKLKIQLENARKSHAKDVSLLKRENARLVREAEQLKIRNTLEKLSKSLTESERSEFISIVSEMKVTSHKDFVTRATKVRDRLYKEEASDYNQFVERFVENRSLVNDSKIVKEEKAPRNVMEAVHDVLSAR